MHRTSIESELRTALAALETSLVTPVVSGELANWIGAVQQAWEHAANEIENSLRRVHPKQYAQIAEQDQALLPKVEQLQAEDEAIQCELEQIAQWIARDARHVPKLEPDEGKAQKHVQALVDAGVAFLTRVRKHEVAVETWITEAFNRDRGGGD